MQDHDKTKEHLMGELDEMRPRVVDVCEYEACRSGMKMTLPDSDETLRLLIEKAPIAMIVTSGVAQAAEIINQKFTELFGYTAEEIPDIDRWWSLVYPEEAYRKRIVTEWTRRVEVAIAKRLEIDPVRTKVRCKDGTDRYVEFRFSSIGKKNVVFCTDLTASKQAEEVINLEKQRFQRLAENSPFGMIIVQPDGTFSYVNPKFTEMFGYDLSEIPDGKAWLKKAYPDSRYRHQVVSTWIEDFNGAKPGETRPRVFTVTCKDGTEKIILFRPVKLDSGEDLTTCEDITDIKRAEEETRRTKVLLYSIIQNLPTAVFLKDAEELRFALWNKTCEELYGHKADDVVGKTAKDVFLGSDASRFESQDREVFKSGRLMEIPDQLVTTRYKGLRMLHTKKIPLIGENGHPSHLLGISEDITARKTAEQELVKAKEVAEQASRAKSEFLANMSHEIRTPMNGIIGMADLALSTELNDEQREYLEAVKVSADSLLGLLNDILDFSKIEAGKLELALIDFGLRDCVANTLITLAISAHKKGLELLYDIPAEIPDGVIGDPGRLRQIFVNLVGNAIKFTAQGEIAVEARLESETDSEVCLQFSVTDTGIGIPADKQETIFCAFEQADGSTTRNYGGTGLGLAVSTQLVHMMGGRIWVESKEGSGSTFRFTVSLGLQDEPTGITLCQDSSNLKDLPVLVVDDNATNRRILEQMLTSWNMKPVSVDHAVVALEEMKRAHERGTPFAVVLIDYMMPDIDGFRLAEQIKGDPDLRAATLIMLTSAGERGHAARCVEVGISAYLMKPVRQSELLETICATLRKTTRTGRATLLTRHVLRESKRRLNVLLAEDNPINQKLATRLLQKMGHRVTVVENGRQALAASMKDQFDVIFMDIQMPEMDGFEATAGIREREKFQDGIHVPILAMTAHAMAGDRERCLEAGMDGYVSKPINVQELAEALENLPIRSQSMD
jgi:two-component system, sensor histidine kinase and response regulator